MFRLRIIGIDPGYAIVGVGVVDYIGNRFNVVDYLAITTEAGVPFEQRLCTVYDGLAELLTLHQPDALSIEQLFYTSNQKTVMHVAEARGVILLAAEKAGIPIFQYTPLQVKQAVAGYGRATKKQVQEMTRVLLSLQKVPRPDDVADALAVSICHAHSYRSKLYERRVDL